MYKKSALTVLALVFSLCLSGCAGTLRGYEPRSPVESTIKETLIRYEDAYNKHDLEGLLAFFLEDAEIMSDKNGQMVSKREYAEILPTKFRTLPRMTSGDPFIFVLESGDRAVVEIVQKLSDIDYPAKISLLLQNNEWKIKKIKYY